MLAIPNPNPRPMPPRLVALLLLAICLALTVLASCSPGVRVARHYRHFTKMYHKQQRQPMHNLPLHTGLD